MKKRMRRVCSLLLAVALVLCMAPATGRAALSGVYFTAANDLLLDLTSDTMPFWSGNTLYVSSRLFEHTDLDVMYVKNSSMGLAMLYTTKTDLRFDLRRNNAYDRDGNTYKGRAITKGGVVFFPVDLVCRYFGLTWTYTETETAPLIRVKNSGAILDDKNFIDAATRRMNDQYASYEKWWRESGGQSGSWPTVQAAEGQKIHLIIETRSAEDTMKLLQNMGTSQATFLLTTEQMGDGNLLRALVGQGHAVALLVTAEDAENAEQEIRLARELLWKNTCSWLNLVWYSGEADLSALAEELGCFPVTAELDRSSTGLTSTTRVRNLLTAISRYRSDLPIFLGADSSCGEHLPLLLEGLNSGEYRVCAWRCA